MTMKVFRVTPMPTCNWSPTTLPSRVRPRDDCSYDNDLLRPDNWTPSSVSVTRPSL